MILYHQIPEDVSADEARLKFRRSEVAGFEPGLIAQQPASLVFRVLSSSDLLIKFRHESGNIVYSHYRHGQSERHRLSWHPVGGLQTDVSTAVHKATLESLAEKLSGLVGVPHGIAVDG